MPGPQIRQLFRPSTPETFELINGKEQASLQISVHAQSLCTFDRLNHYFSRLLSTTCQDFFGEFPLPLNEDNGAYLQPAARGLPANFFQPEATALNGGEMELVFMDRLSRLASFHYKKSGTGPRSPTDILVWIRPTIIHELPVSCFRGPWFRFEDRAYAHALH